jgi:hypothetical protein
MQVLSIGIGYKFCLWSWRWQRGSLWDPASLMTSSYFLCLIRNQVTVSHANYSIEYSWSK